jgi:predicted permease
MIHYWLDDFRRDLAYGLRLLRRSPAFAAVALTTLAVGIGATVTMFSIVDAWLLKPLAFPQADRIVVGLAATQERPTEPAVFLPYRSYLTWKARSHSFDAVSATFRRSYLIGGRGEATTAMGQVVSPEFFPALGLSPEVGRTLTASDAGGPAVVVLSHGFWQRHFGGSTAAVGDHLTLNGTPHEVVGVMPPEFDVRMLDQARGFELWTLFRPGETGYGPDGIGPIAVVGRLREGVSMAAAQAELSTIHRDAESGYADNFQKFIVHLATLQADNTRTVRATLVTLSGAVACLLLVACMNVGALLIGRGLARTREAAIRAAIGSGRGRLVRQFLTESLVISAIGCGAGIVLAVNATRLFAIWNPLDLLPSTTIRIDVRTVTFAALVMAVTTIVSGLVPAWRVGATDPNEALRSGGERGSTGGRAQRAQLILLSAQIAVSVVLLVAATLLVRTLVRLQHEPLGFNPSNLTVARVALPADQYRSSEARNLFVGQLSRALGALPGVERVAAGTSPALSSGPPVSVRTVADDTTPALRISAQDVTPDFFDTLGISVVGGRLFDARDSASSPPVTVLNENAARAIFGSPSAAVGRRIRIGAASAPAWRDVVGVVQNTRSSFYNTLEWVTNPVIYLPAPQAFGVIRDPTVSSFGVHLFIRAPRALPMAEIKRAVSALNDRVPVSEVQAASSAVATATKQPAFRTALLGWFAVASLALAAIGVYGLVVQSIARRMREIGIRLALGADPRAVRWVVARRALAAGVAGWVCGSIGAMLFASAMKSLLYGVAATDAWSLVGAGAVLLAVTAATAFAAAARATRINPVEVLRAE